MNLASLKRKAKRLQKLRGIARDQLIDAELIHEDLTRQCKEAWNAYMQHEFVMRNRITLKGKSADAFMRQAMEADEMKTKTEELKGIKRVLILVDGYLSTQPPELALAWDGGVMTYGELREHLKAALKTKILNLPT